jgi:Fe-S oxidoreductase
MTITYDPKHPAYMDEADLRQELTRVYDICSSCRLCWNLCPSFGSLFAMIDEAHDGDVEALTDAEQDRVIDECYQCKLCYVKCPYIPPHEWQLDFPRLMLRGGAIRAKKRGFQLVDQALSRTDAVGKLSTAVAPIANLAIGKPGSLPRKILEKATGIAAERILPSYATQRFSAWFKKRSRTHPPASAQRPPVVLFQTCLVEYQNPGIGQDAVKVFERNGIPVEIADGAVCCGMPWLDAGNVDKFLKQAAHNVAALAAAVRNGRDVVVAQPTCAYTLKKEYAQYLGTEDARAVAAHSFDLSEYLMRVHRQGGGLDTRFSGSVPETVSWHVPCHLRAQNIGHRSKELLELAGATVTPIERCAGIDGTWGLRAQNYQLARKVAQPLKQAIEHANAACVAGDCHLANGAILEETGRAPLHPVQVLARAYGIPEEKS